MSISRKRKPQEFSLWLPFSDLYPPFTKIFGKGRKRGMGE
jgi:hypothetical protein